jgi:hypothetical protein
MDFAHNVTAHVPSEQTCEKMIYYTYHRYIIALRYVFVDVSSNYSGSGKIYYTQHRYMVILQYATEYVSAHHAVF